MKLAREQSVSRGAPFGMIATLLACLFAGIWTSDGAALVLLDPPGGDLAMRVSSLVVYASLFAGISVRARKREHAAACEANLNRYGFDRLLVLAICIAVAAYLLGSVLMLRSDLLDGSARAFVALIAFFLMKGIGAPLSVMLVRLCAALPYRLIARASTFGILGAFVLKEIIGAVATSMQLDTAATFGAGSISILAAACGATLAVRGLHADENGHRSDGSVPDASTESATTQLPFSALANRNLAAGMVVASMMLGFLRSGTSIGPVDSPPAVVAALVIIAIAVQLLPNVGMHELFRGALVCTAAGFLLGPLLDMLAAGGGEVLVCVGTALFEVVVWMVTVVIVRSCSQQTLAAAAARLVTVVGHLAGAALGMLAEAWAQVDAAAPEAFSLVIVFAYVVMLVYLFNDPVAKLPLTTGRLATAPKRPNPEAGRAATISAAAVASTEPTWEQRCVAIAREHGLTPRETQVLEQLARGRDLAFMEEKFVLSRNTVKMHIKHVYEKLGVHSKQEVIDLVEAERPSS